MILEVRINIHSKIHVNWKTFVSEKCTAKGETNSRLPGGDLLRLTSFLHKVFPKSDAALKVGCVLEWSSRSPRKLGRKVWFAFATTPLCSVNIPPHNSQSHGKCQTQSVKGFSPATRMGSSRRFQRKWLHSFSRIVTTKSAAPLPLPCFASRFVNSNLSPFSCTFFVYDSGN